MIKHGNALRPSATIEADYRRELRVFVMAMRKNVLRVLEGQPANVEGVTMDADVTASPELQKKIQTLKQKYDSILERMGKIAATRFLEQQIKFAGRSFIHSIRPLVEGKNATFALPQPSAVTAESQAFIEENIANNVSLIKSIGSDYFARIEKEVLRSMDGHTSIAGLKRAVQKIGGISERRAKLIANDQTAKIYTQLCARQMQKAGITKAVWRHSSAGKKPREFHKTRWDGNSEPPNGLNGYVFDVAHPPVADPKTGEIALPGELINCRCFYTPVLDV